jgi:hypothetical protein
MLISIEPP